MQPLLNRQEQEKLISEMWGAALSIDDPSDRHIACEQASATEKAINEQLEIQDSFIAKAWEWATTVNAADPLSVVVHHLNTVKSDRRHLEMKPVV